ncbi:MAG: tRNA (adenosine(37)-N6)-threonylcarbamoyltransferase complex dimerization subunit type 1 TsaB [Clostridiales bacterium]|nr:tRNA (adenosine(37)-N6)-threonylcarbamoyltransferase complex dimerization subunit type 1 TsaB [Clostridiales bacterium]
MIILGVDTSCEQASCALYIEGIIHEIRSEADKRKHSEKLMPMVDGLLKKNGVKPDAIDLFAVSEGPGSFTGLRIGMASIKGMAYALKKNIITIKTPDVLANHFSSDSGIVCPVIDARNNQVYTAVYEWENGFYRAITDYMGVKTEDLLKILLKYQNINFCGDAAIMHYEFFIKNGLGCIKPDTAFLYPSADILVKMAASGLGDIVNPAEAVPFYLRVSQAERFYGKG